MGEFSWGYEGGFYRGSIGFFRVWGLNSLKVAI